MIRGIYTAASGMASQMRAQDISANNLANVNTTGYKKDVPALAAFPELFLHRFNDGAPGVLGIRPWPVPLGTLGTGVWVEEVATDMKQGSLRETGRELDFALRGDGFFVIATPGGRRYTRNGSFNINAEGQLVTAAGHRVLGRDGASLYHDDEDLMDELLVVDFAPGTVLTKEGESLYLSTEEGQAVADPGIVSGTLEESNVDVVTAMVEMIDVMRAYEANQKVVQVQDQTLGKTVNEVGRVG
ncbi:MAG: flagellar hook-basal body protein [Firmicutes bacterium]|nr:flagellar hook-basal body protein [Bacillota bacterium]